MASTNINKYVTHYPVTSSTHLQYGYNNQQPVDTPKTSYVHTSSAPAPLITTSHTTHSELSQDITSLLLKEQGAVTDSTKRVLQTSSVAVADYLSHLPTLHHFLKYSAETAAIKKEGVVGTIVSFLRF